MAGPFFLGGIGGSGAACCCASGPPPCTSTICVTGCPSGSELVGATVSVKTIPGGTEVGPLCTTADDGAGHACCYPVINGPGGYGPGNYLVTVSMGGYVTWQATRYLDCGTTLSVQLQPNTAPATVAFTVHGCCGAALPGATITLSDGQSCTTDASGQCSFWIGAAGTYTYTISKSRFVDATGSVTVSACQATTTGVTLALTPASGYACGPTDQNDNGLADPIPTTLSLTDSVYGGCTLTWDAANLWWHGQLSSASFPGGCNCPAASFTIDYYLYQCNSQVSHLTLTAEWSNADYGQCISGSFFPIQDACPFGGTPTDCSVAPDGSDIYTTGGFTTSLPWNGGFTNWTVHSGVPFDATFTIAALARCPAATSFDPNLPWPSGGTITISE